MELCGIWRAEIPGRNMTLKAVLPIGEDDVVGTFFGLLSNVEGWDEVCGTMEEFMDMAVIRWERNCWSSEDCMLLSKQAMAKIDALPDVGRVSVPPLGSLTR